MVVVVLPRLTERGGLEPGCTAWGSWTLTTSRWDERAFLSVLFAFLCLNLLLVTINQVNGYQQLDLLSYPADSPIYSAALM